MLVALTVSWPLVARVGGVEAGLQIRFPLASSVIEAVEKPAIVLLYVPAAPLYHKCAPVLPST